MPHSPNGSRRPGRPDRVELLQASNMGRMPALIPLRVGRMATSPFALYRGAASLMVADLARGYASA